MALTLRSLADEVRPILNDIGLIHDFSLARIVGVAEDDEDYYYIGMDHRGRRRYYSAVGSCVSLRSGYPPARYAALEGIFTINGGAPVAELEIVRLDSTGYPSGARCAPVPDEASREQALARARLALACAYQAVGAALLGYTPGRPTDRDVTDLLDMLSRWEAYSEEQILTLLPWPKRWVRRTGPVEVRS